MSFLRFLSLRRFSITFDFLGLSSSISFLVISSMTVSLLVCSPLSSMKTSESSGFSSNVESGISPITSGSSDGSLTKDGLCTLRYGWSGSIDASSMTGPSSTGDSTGTDFALSVNGVSGIVTTGLASREDIKVFPPSSKKSLGRVFVEDLSAGLTGLFLSFCLIGNGFGVSFLSGDLATLGFLGLCVTLDARGVSAGFSNFFFTFETLSSVFSLVLTSPFILGFSSGDFTFLTGVVTLDGAFGVLVGPTCSSAAAAAEASL